MDTQLSHQRLSTTVIATDKSTLIKAAKFDVERIAPLAHIGLQYLVQQRWPKEFLTHTAYYSERWTLLRPFLGGHVLYTEYLCFDW